jgi:hypothetical protein
MDKNIVPVPDPAILLTYPPEEDIYQNSTPQELIEPEDPLIKIIDEGEPNRDPLEVPGTDLDDAEEVTGNEDEENNYYSLGGDEHSVLDENNRE